LEYVAVFVLGLVVGSFLNVCVYRVPRGLSVIAPGSHCPSCGASIGFRHNIPLLSYALLRGRCRSCGGAISVRYPVVEALTGIVFLLLALRIGLQPVLVAYLAFAAALICIFFIDIEWSRIPNVFILVLLPAGVLFSLWALPGGWKGSLIGMVVGFAFLAVMATGYRLATGVEGMGAGDIKLAALIGCYLGATQTLAVIVLAALGGSLAGLLLMAVKRANRRTALPFGAFMAAAAMVVLLLPAGGSGLLAVFSARF